MSSIIERRADWSVEYPLNTNFGKMLVSARVYQSSESHDILVLKYKGAIGASKYDDIKKGDPVKFTWKSGINTSVFIGFVHTIERIATYSNTFTEVTCINNSSLLKKPSKKVYKNLTADAIISEITDTLPYGFKALTSNSKYVYSSIPQSGQSYWQFMCQLAKQSGFALRAENTQIIFKNKDVLLNEKLPYAPTFHYYDLAPFGASTMQTLLSFKVLDSILSPETSQGDVGVLVHDHSGTEYRFTPGNKINNGDFSNTSLTPPSNWDSTYGVVPPTTVDGRSL